MSALLVEIGNTALKAAWSDGDTIGKTFRYQGEKIMDYIESLTEKEKPDVLVLASVQEISEAETLRCKQLCERLIILDSMHKIPTEGIPAFLPADRYAELIAVRHLFKGKPCTVIDLGTTLTVDYITETGDYAGGSVSLGLRTRFKALNRYSKNIPLVNIPEETCFPGESMLSSIETGAVTGIMFEIQGYIDKFPDNIIVFTGGDANYFAKRMKNSIFVASNLVLMGLALITGK